MESFIPNLSTLRLNLDCKSRFILVNISNNEINLTKKLHLNKIGG